MNLGTGFLNPVRSGQAEIKEAILNVSGDFLRADEPDFKRGIVNGRAIRAGVCANAEPCTPEKFQRGFLKAPGREADPKGLHDLQP
jgi:hypothetical protein